MPAATNIRILAPIPGKARIGIEVLNDKKEMVCLEEVVNSDRMSKIESKGVGIKVHSGEKGIKAQTFLSAADHLLKLLQEVEKAHIRQILTDNDWNIARSAKTLGIDRSTLYSKIKRYEIKNSDPEQRRLKTKSLSRPRTHQRSNDRAPERHTHCEPVLKLT